MLSATPKQSVRASIKISTLREIKRGNDVLAGFGFSDKPRGLDPTPYSVYTYADVAESLLEHLDVAAVHVLAHDIGDTVAQELMARRISRQAEGGLTGGSHVRGDVAAMHTRIPCLLDPYA